MEKNNMLKSNKIFAEDAPLGFTHPVKFGTYTPTETPDDVVTDKFSLGFTDSDEVNPQNLNSLFYYVTAGLTYLAQHGLPEYSPFVDYPAGAVVTHDGSILLAIKEVKASVTKKSTEGCNVDPCNPCTEDYVVCGDPKEPLDTDWCAVVTHCTYDLDKKLAENKLEALATTIKNLKGVELFEITKKSEEDDSLVLRLSLDDESTFDIPMDKFGKVVKNSDGNITIINMDGDEINVPLNDIQNSITTLKNKSTSNEDNISTLSEKLDTTNTKLNTTSTKLDSISEKVARDSTKLNDALSSINLLKNGELSVKLGVDAKGQPLTQGACIVTCDDLNDMYNRIKGEIPIDKFLSNVGYNKQSKILRFTIEDGTIFEAPISDLAVSEVKPNSGIIGNGTTTSPLALDLSTQISKDKGNLLEYRKNGLYYGIYAPANISTVYVDPDNGVDQNPDLVKGAGTREKPLKTIKYAILLGNRGQKRIIKVKENTVIRTSEQRLGRLSLKDDVTFMPYGEIFDSLSKDTFRYLGLSMATHHAFYNHRPKIILDHKTFYKDRDGFGESFSYHSGAISVDTQVSLKFLGFIIENPVIPHDELQREIAKITGGIEETKQLQFRNHSYQGLIRASSPLNIRFDGCTFIPNIQEYSNIAKTPFKAMYPILSGNGAGYVLKCYACDLHGRENDIDSLGYLVEGHNCLSIHVGISRQHGEPYTTFVTKDNAKQLFKGVIANEYAFRNISSNLNPSWFV